MFYFGAGNRNITADKKITQTLVLTFWQTKFLSRYQPGSTNTKNYLAAFLELSDATEGRFCCDTGTFNRF